MRKTSLFFFVLMLSLSALAQQSRHFTFHYAFTVRNVPPGQKIEIWFPQAHSDQFQQIKIISAKGDLPLKKTRESKYGNTIFHAIAPKAAKDEYKFDVEYDVVRQERIGLPRNGSQPHLVKASAKETNGYLGPDKLVPITGKLADIAEKQVQGHTGTMDRARVLYDYVLNTMRYDKSGTGWGRGDAEWACDSKRGNCTDFHSVFISMVARSTSPRGLRLASHYPPTRIRARLPGTTAGPSSTIRSMGGCPWIFLKPGRTRVKKIISSARTTRTASSFPWAAI